MHSSRFSDNNNNYILKSHFSSKHNQQFFLQHFNIKYIGADLAFFDELYDRFKAKYPEKLRETINEESANTTTIQQLIQKANFDAAFQMIKRLSNQMKKEDQDSLVILESQYSGYEQIKQSGTATQEHLDVTLSRIRSGLIEMTKKIT